MNADRRVEGGETACARFDALLPELIGLDGEGSTMSTAEKEALLRHGETCARCSDTRRAYTATVDLLRGLPRKTAPSDFLSWVSGDLPASTPAVPGRRSWKPWLAIAAAVPVLAAAIHFASLAERRPVPEIAVAPAPSASEPSRDLAAKAIPPSAPGAAIAETDAATDLGAARFDEAVALPAEEKAKKADEMIVLALPYVAGRWESDVASLEVEMRGRFVDPPRSAAPVTRRVAQPSFGGPGGSARPARAEGVALEDMKKDGDRADAAATERRDASVPPRAAADARSEVAAAVAAPPQAREITLSLDPARLAELRSFVDRWSAPRFRAQARGARQEAELQLEERLEAAPRQTVTVRIRIEPLLPASRDPKSP